MDVATFNPSTVPMSRNNCPHGFPWMVKLRPEVDAISPDVVKVGGRGSNSGLPNPSLLSLTPSLSFFFFPQGRWIIISFLASGFHANQCSALNPHLTYCTICKQASGFVVNLWSLEKIIS